MSTISTQKHSSAVIKKPRITEKATISIDNNQYVFEVTPEATKSSVMQAIKAIYKVTPYKVNIVRLPAKKVVVRGRPGKRSAIKKAYVFLKKGDKIEIA